MQKMSPKKQMSIIRLYLGGYSYDDIASRGGVSKGTVANIVTDLKAGRIPEVQDNAEQLELLRELSVELRRSRSTVVESLVGLTIFSQLQQIGIEPAEIQSWAAVCRQLPSEEADVKTYFAAALSVEQVRQRTGLTPEALGEKVCKLEEKAALLEPLAKEAKKRQQDIQELGKQKQAKTEEITQLEKRWQPLSLTVAQYEKRETELSQRVQELEQRVQATDERLATARRDLKKLADLGMSTEELTGFVQEVNRVAQHHNMVPKALRSRLMQEIGNLDVGLGLETLIVSTRIQATEAEKSAVNAKKQQAVLETDLAELRRERAVQLEKIQDEEKKVREQIRSTAEMAKKVVAELRQDLAANMSGAMLEVEKLRNKAMELGNEAGRAKATIESNRWLQTLVSLFKGDGTISVQDIRSVLLPLFRGFKDYIERNNEHNMVSLSLTMHLDGVIGEFEKWKE